MNFSNNVVNILTAKTYRGIGTAWIINNIKGNEEAEDIVALIKKSSSQHSSLELSDFQIVQNNVRNELEKISHEFDGAVALGDSNFPFLRGNIKNSEKPSVLFYKGDISLISKSSFNIAVIGLLKPNEKIEMREKQVVSELVQYGATIVSGLALGCDTIAHRQALNCGAKTVAVLPSTVNKISPATNRNLAQEILQKGGLLISEYYKEPSSQKETISRYIERDRLQAMFSNGIVLSASYAKNNKGNDSGSRHAMEYAKNYGLPRAVIYNNELDFQDEQFDLNRKIINEDQNTFTLTKTSIKSFIDKAKSQKSTIEQAKLI